MPRIKDMGRRQQKAAFANMGNPNSRPDAIDRDKLLKKEFPDKSLDIRKRRLTFEEFKKSEFAKKKMTVNNKPFKDMKERYVFFIIEFHKDKPDTGDFLDKQLGYNKDGDTPIYGR